MLRFTKKIGDENYEAIHLMESKNKTISESKKDIEIQRCLNRLGKYEDIYERLDKIFLKNEGLSLEIITKCMEHYYSDDKLVYEIYRFCGDGIWDIDIHEISFEDLLKIGRTVFFTKKEAEERIKVIEI